MNNTYYLVRHGESKYNLEMRHQGWSFRNPLTELGFSQVSKIASVIKNYPIDCIYSSPLLRTRQTARIVSQNINRPVRYSRHLLDYRRSKSQEGLHVHEYSSLPEYQAWKANSASNPNFSLPDGESRQQLSNRISKFIQQSNNRHHQKHILVVAHTDVIYQMVFHMTNKTIDKQNISHCMLCIIDPDKQELVVVNASA